MRVRLLVASLAVVVNAAALATVHAAMGQILERERLAQQQPARVVVVGKRSEQIAVENCPSPSPKVL